MESDTRVDFYVLATAGRTSRLNFACRLAEKAYALKHRVYAHAATNEDARELDELLWTFKQGSFIPHQLLDESADDRTPVRIGTPDCADKSGDLLINLAAEVPSFSDRFARIAEIVDASEAAKDAGRERFRQYRAMGFSPVTHTID